MSDLKKASSDGDEKPVVLQTMVAAAEDVPLNPLVRGYFPSKVGGYPVWLSPKSIPKEDKLHCNNCNGRMKFLLQMYAPISSTKQAFHRTLYVFMCTKGSCMAYRGSIKVFRSQLSEDNPYYPANPPLGFDVDMEAYVEDYDSAVVQRKKKGGKAPATSKSGCGSCVIPVDGAEPRVNVIDPNDPLWSSLCCVCGCLATKVCAGCKVVRFCCKEHQVEEMRRGHEDVCGQLKERRQALLHAFAEQSESKSDSKLEWWSRDLLEQWTSLQFSNGQEDEDEEAYDDDEDISVFEECAATEKWASLQDIVATSKTGGKCGHNYQIDPSDPRWVALKAHFCTFSPGMGVYPRFAAPSYLLPEYDLSLEPDASEHRRILLTDTASQSSKESKEPSNAENKDDGDKSSSNSSPGLSEGAKLTMEKALQVPAEQLVEHFERLDAHYDDVDEMDEPSDKEGSDNDVQFEQMQQPRTSSKTKTGSGNKKKKRKERQRAAKSDTTALVRSDGGNELTPIDGGDQKVQIQTFYDESTGKSVYARIEEVPDDYNDDIMTNDSQDPVDVEYRKVYHQMRKGERDDPVYALFKEVVEAHPSQVLRWQSWSQQQKARGQIEPLWASTTGRLSRDKVPDCEHCGNPRYFEMQIMPQVLYHLNLDNSNRQTTTDSPDWGCVAIYSCSASCTEGQQYCEEFAYRQKPI